MSTLGYAGVYLNSFHFHCTNKSSSRGTFDF